MGALHLEPRPPGRPVRSAGKSKGRLWVAFAIALLADVLQIAIFPLFIGGAASPWQDALDGVVGVVLVALLGFQWPLLPAFVAELVPVVDIVPTWTAAVLIVARRRRAAARLEAAADPREKSGGQPQQHGTPSIQS